MPPLPVYCPDPAEVLSLLYKFDWGRTILQGLLGKRNYSRLPKHFSIEEGELCSAARPAKAGLRVGDATATAFGPLQATTDHFGAMRHKDSQVWSTLNFHRAPMRFLNKFPEHRQVGEGGSVSPSAWHPPRAQPFGLNSKTPAPTSLPPLPSHWTTQITFGAS
jgi:hypothetical protein